MSLPRSPWSSGAQNTCQHLELPAVTTTAACPTHGHGRLPKGRTGDQHNQSPGVFPPEYPRLNIPPRDKVPQGLASRNTNRQTGPLRALRILPDPSQSFHPETRTRRGLHHNSPPPTQTVSQAMQSLVGSPSWSAPRRVSTVSSSPDSRTSPSRALQSSHVHIHSSPGSRPPKTKRLKSLPGRISAPPARRSV